jgi:type I restriction enzyme S subunit
MSKYRAYPVYKDSGVEWLGDVPEHWDIKRLKFLAQISNGHDQKQVIDDNGCYPIYGSGGIFGRANEYLYNQPSVLLGRKGTIDKPLFVTEPFWTVDTMYYTKIYPITFPKFFFYQCLTIQFAMYQYGSALPSMTQESLNGVLFSTPEYEEQQQIAAFLDNKTAHLDTLIEKKQQMIGLLNEKRIALITQAVTKGLDLSVPMKDSGVEWLGNVPEHWEMKRLKFVFLLQRGHDLSTDKMKGGEYPVCASNGVIGWHNEYTSIAPSVVVGRSGSVGEVNYVEQKFWAHNTALYIKQFFDCMPRYSYYLLCVLDLKSLSFGSAVGSLNRNYIHDLKIVIPNVIEQAEVVAYIETETAKIDRMINTVQSAIAKLQEYRTALITAAVTGKINVSSFSA